jgi:formimidoylglutamate deiminase
VPASHLLDALVFSSPDARFSEVFVAGRRVHRAGPELRAAFVRAMNALWS